MTTTTTASSDVLPRPVVFRSDVGLPACLVCCPTRPLLCCCCNGCFFFSSRPLPPGVCTLCAARRPWACERRTSAARASPLLSAVPPPTDECTCIAPARCTRINITHYYKKPTRLSLYCTRSFAPRERTKRRPTMAAAAVVVAEMASTTTMSVLSTFQTSPCMQVNAAATIDADSPTILFVFSLTFVLLFLLSLAKACMCKWRRRCRRRSRLLTYALLAVKLWHNFSLHPRLYIYDPGPLSFHVYVYNIQIRTSTTIFILVSAQL